MHPTHQSLASKIAAINMAILELRSEAVEPFSLRINDVIDVELHPAKESNRVLVGRAGMGRTVVNYTDEGVIVDVFGEDEIDPVHTVAIHSSDLVAYQDDEFASQVAARNVFAELSVAKSVSASCAALQTPDVRMDLLTCALAGAGLDPDDVVLRLNAVNGMKVQVTAQMLEHASPLGERGWLLASGFELWFEPLQVFRVQLVESDGRQDHDQTPIAQEFWAENIEHAKEQAESAYPGCRVI